jgi:hypothetical protein
MGIFNVVDIRKPRRVRVGVDVGLTFLQNAGFPVDLGDVYRLDSS